MTDRVTFGVVSLSCTCNWKLAAALFRGLRTVDRQRCFHQPSAVFRSGILKQFQHDGIKRGLESGKSEIPYRDITG